MQPKVWYNEQLSVAVWLQQFFATSHLKQTQPIGFYDILVPKYVRSSI